MVPSRARGVGCRALVVVLLGLVLLLGRAAAAGGAQDAERFVSALGERTLVALRGSADPQQRVRDLAGLLDQAVDVKLVGRLVLATHQFSHAAHNGGGATSRCRHAWRRRMPRLEREVRPRRRLRGCRSGAFFRPAWRRGPRPTSRSRPPRTGPAP